MKWTCKRCGKTGEGQHELVEHIFYEARWRAFMQTSKVYQPVLHWIGRN